MYTMQDCHQAFTNIMREWRNLKMLMRAGRKHAEEDIGATKLGGLAVPC